MSDLMVMVMLYKKLEDMPEWASSPWLTATDKGGRGAGEYGGRWRSYRFRWDSEGEGWSCVPNGAEAHLRFVEKAEEVVGKVEGTGFGAKPHKAMALAGVALGIGVVALRTLGRRGRG